MITCGEQHIDKLHREGVLLRVVSYWVVSPAVETCESMFDDLQYERCTQGEGKGDEIEMFI